MASVWRSIRRHPRRSLIVLGAILVLIIVVSAALRLRIPEPTGPYAVGRTRMAWIDTARSEEHTSDRNDRREVPTTFWYPTDAERTERDPYVASRDEIADGLVESDRLAPFEPLSRLIVFGLRFVRDNIVVDASPSSAGGPYPVVLFSPGNGGNVSFYASIAEDLASHGYVVVGIDHPYQGAAVELSEGDVAVYDAASLETEGGFSSDVFQERVSDVSFVLDQLEVLKRKESSLGDVLDLQNVGIIGHSNGGITAVEACRSDERFDACLNMDGQHRGGPFSYRAEGAAPDRPFLYLTKETEIHPVIYGRFEETESSAYRVVIPEAEHDYFSDGPLLESAFVPFSKRPRDVIDASRAIIESFFGHTLKGEEEVEKVEAPVEVHFEGFS